MAVVTRFVIAGGGNAPHPASCTCAECALTAREDEVGSDAARSSSDTMHYDRGGLRVAAFRLGLTQRPFRDTGPIENFILVFPRLSVVIHHADKAPVVADPTRAMLYNRGQEYERHAVSERGDACEWFGFPEAAVADTLRAHEPAVDDRPGRPFARTHMEVSPRTYLLQRRIFDYLRRRGAAADPFLVEDAMYRLLHAVLGPAPGVVRRPERSVLDRRRAVVEQTRKLLGESLRSPMSLDDLATRVGLSACHLSTVFSGEMGISIHAYRNELRLLTALERLGDGEEIPEVARKVGFSSHSHFTAAFRRMFGIVPSAWEARTQTLPDRREPAVGLLSKVDAKLRR